MSTNYKPVDQCRTVAELLEDPARWTKGKLARNAEGIVEEVESGSACCWCLVGACRRVYGIGDDYFTALAKIAMCFPEPNTSTVLWNDAPERTHAEVLELVRRAGI